jgi:phosphatidylserine decarboxylase
LSHNFVSTFLMNISGRIAYKVSRIEKVWIKLLLIKVFIRLYNIDTSELLQKDLKKYTCFNDFFIRRLRPQSRPINHHSDSIISPSDGTITEYGLINNGKLIQAKGYDYKLIDLLGENAPYEKDSLDLFLTIYLSPYNYHRVHMPFDGDVLGAQYIPGANFSVSPRTLSKVGEVFSRNERVVFWLKSSLGVTPLVMVGALNVASLSTYWHPEIKSNNEIFIKVPLDVSRKKKGDELGWFNLGSTVILLLPSTKVALSVPSTPSVMMGDGIATYKL